MRSISIAKTHGVPTWRHGCAYGGLGSLIYLSLKIVSLQKIDLSEIWIPMDIDAVDWTLLSMRYVDQVVAQFQ